MLLFFDLQTKQPGRHRQRFTAIELQEKMAKLENGNRQHYRRNDGSIIML